MCPGMTRHELPDAVAGLGLQVALGHLQDAVEALGDVEAQRGAVGNVAQVAQLLGGEPARRACGELELVPVMGGAW